MKKNQNTIKVNDSENITSKPTNKWDECLNDYSNYIKEYIKHYKKSLKGDTNSSGKYPYMKAKFEDLNNKLNQAQSKQLLNQKQLNRKLKIQMKLIHALNN
ncbi:hypothetical protein [Flavobacterium sp.]|uniref:hypothetical protein n=1 Tax=Flavobacterium sp. TaxID=239 RepID=UPI00286B34B5|nr:hypothetical protein [Flavobacterium sp.]